VGANIDTLDAIARFEQELAGDAAAPDRREFLLTILRRWQDDPDLTMESRHRAGSVLRQFRGD
jgi:hypothetical protein